MYVESFHYVLKSAYMEHKANRRVDTLLTILLREARKYGVRRIAEECTEQKTTQYHQEAQSHPFSIARTDVKWLVNTVLLASWQQLPGCFCQGNLLLLSAMSRVRMCVFCVAKCWMIRLSILK